MPELDQLTAPVMRSSAGFHADEAGRQLRKEPQHLCAPQLPANQNLARRIHPVHLEDALRQVHTDRANFLHRRLLSIRSLPTTSSWHVDAVAGAVHPISLKS